MNSIRILWRRELRHWLTLPSFYLMGAICLAITGMAFWMFAVTMAGKGLLTSEITFSGMMFWLSFLAMASAISVRLLGDEREQGTLELLLTAPVSEPGIIVAKAGAGLELILLLAFPSVLYPWLLRVVYPGWHGVDIAMWFAGVLLVVLLAGLMTLCGMFWSQVFRRQTPAMMATFLTGVLLVFRGSLRSWIGGGAAEGSTGFVAVASHVASFAAGMVDSRPVIFYLTAMAVLLFINIRLLQLIRFRRPLGWLNVAVSSLLAIILAGMVNFLALAHPVRVDISTLGKAPLSVTTARTLESLKSPVRVILLAPSGEALARNARRVVEKYRHVHPALGVEIVDEGGDLVRTRELVEQFKLRESNVLIVTYGRRIKVLPLREMVRSHEGPTRYGQRGSTFYSALDEELNSALYSVSREHLPAVYFLTGHDERRLSDFADYRGYSEITGIIRDRHADVRPLFLELTGRVTNDCSVLVIAGPARSLATWEVAKIRDYLIRGGRLMLLLDSGHATGLETLLEEWGVVLGQNRVIGSRNATLLPESRERASALGMGAVSVIRYGAHPISEGLDGLVSTFVLPRSVEALTGSGARGNLSDMADKPRVTPLAFTSDQSWADVDLRQNPPQFNEGYDAKGPVCIAACVEKGVPSEITMDIKPIRLVVFGDSQFAANRCLAGGNEAFFINALEWLLERDAVSTTSTEQRGLYNLQIESDGRLLTFLVIVVAVPVMLVALMGVVALVRRDKRVVTGTGRRVDSGI